MTEKDLKRLSRADLLEMLIDQSIELRKTQEALRIAEAKLESRRIAIDQSGSIAEAALRLNGLFEAAQASCEQYIENIRLLNERQEVICKKREEESIQSAAARLVETEKRCADMEAETKERCVRMLEKTRNESTACLEDVSNTLDAFCSKHAEVQELLNVPRMNR